MATKNVIAGSPSAADTLELGVSGGVVQIASGADFYIKDVGAITTSQTKSQAAGTALQYTVNLCTTSVSDSTAVTLPTAVAGLLRLVYVPGGAYSCAVYPNVSDDINDGTVDVHVDMKEKTLAIFLAVDATTWACIYTVNT